MIIRWILLGLVLVQVTRAVTVTPVLQLPKPPAVSNYTEELWLYPKEDIVEPYHVFHQPGLSEIIVTQSGCQLFATLTNTTVIQSNVSLIYPKTKRWMHLATTFSLGDTNMLCALLVNGYNVPCESSPPKELYTVQAFETP